VLQHASGLVSLLASAQLLRKCMIGWIVGCLDRHPYWCLWNTLCESKNLITLWNIIFLAISRCLGGAIVTEMLTICSWSGTMPVSNYELIVCLGDMYIIPIVSLNNLVDISSWTGLKFDFSLWVVCITILFVIHPIQIISYNWYWQIVIIDVQFIHIIFLFFD